MPMQWGLLVVLLGLLLGGFLVWRSRQGVSAGQIASVVDAQHRMAELERERDRLLARLRTSDLTDQDRGDLELAAARVLREMESLGAQSLGGQSLGGPSKDASLAASKGSAHQAESAEPPVAAPLRRSAWAGFAWGIAISTAVVALALMAGRSSRDRQEGEPITGGDSVVMGQPTQGGRSQGGRGEGGTAPGFDHPAGEVPQEVEQQLQELEARWTQQQDLGALKELTLANLGLERFMESFRWSQEILNRAPDDPDGHYAQGVVRMAMGQTEAAVEHFDRVLSGFPNHLLALVAKGVTLKGAGRLQEARGAWEMALLVAGGSHPEIERLIAELDRPAESVGATGAPSVEAAPAESKPATSAEVATGYNLNLTCAGNNRADFLFVIVRTGPGPPIAAKRVDLPRLPQQLTVTAADSMMGGALPDQATVSVRWDGDGNAMTREGIGEVSQSLSLGDRADFELCAAAQ